MGGLSITGYVLEPTRVGSANSPYTQTPNIYISDQAAFDAAYPSDESAPRTDYFVFVLSDGDFPSCAFCWTKNEVINRFDYDGREQRFRSLPGKAVEQIGTLTLNSNVDRLAVVIPISTDLTSYPVRISVGSGAGTAFTISLVLLDADLNNPDPSVGTVQLSRESGNLGWAPADLLTYIGQDVQFQRQHFYGRAESNGLLGLIENTLLLNPLPATGQFPLLRIGYRSYLEPIEVSTLGSPVPGTVQWHRTTGELRFNATDLVTYAGASIYYDGVTMAFAATVSQGTAGTISSPGVIPLPLPPEASDLFFRALNPSFPGGFVQFPQSSYVNTLSAYGTKGIVEVQRSNGQIQFSLADRSAYGIGTVQYVLADLDIERGMTLRMFRTPVDLEGLDTETLRDTSAYYSTEGSVWSDPMIGSPFVVLPAIPIEDQTVKIEVSQGTGAFIGELLNLNVPSPPSGYGYVLNLDSRRLEYARRRSDLIVQKTTDFGAAQLPDQLVFNSNLLLELEDSPGGGTYSSLVLEENVLFDFTSGLLTFVETDGSFITDSTSGSFNGTTFTDVSQSFLSYPVLAGDLLIVTSGSAAGIYTVSTVGTDTLTTNLSGGVESNLRYEIRRGSEILADRYFKVVPPLDPNTRVERVSNLGTVSNSPRLAIDLAYIDTCRFWFDLTTFSATVTKVANDAAFSTPSSLREFKVEISEDTGNLNFSQTAIANGRNVRFMQTLTLGTDYQLQSPLGFIEFSSRMLESEEVYLTYAIIDENEKVLVSERGAFLVRKELTESHPIPTSLLSFNPLGREVASNPPPQAFRGGRPQVTGEQVIFDTATSTVKFLSDSQVTDALPHGSIIESDENVYVDYYVYGAIGGEKTLTVLQPPMVTILVSIAEGGTEFTIGGDRTSVFKANYLLKIDNSEIYLIGSSAYDSVTELTTVTLAPLQSFRSDLTNPSLSVTSGATRTTGYFFFLSYFISEVNAWDTPPRGAAKVYIHGDRTREYMSGTILLFTDGSTFQDFAEVTGSIYDEVTDKTAVVLTSNNPRQYDSGSITLKRSVRAVLSAASSTISTSKTPVLDQGYTVYRQVEGQVGQLLVQPDDFSIDDAGRITFVSPLQEEEEMGILYTGTRVIEANRRVRASYTHAIAPTSTNGLEGQILQADYTTYLPDSFYWRVETFTNFRGELATQYENDAKASIPSGGPRLENSSQPKLYEQGRESVWFEEQRLANEDLVARPTLKYYNDAINYLEDALQEMDGRVIGDHNGRFLFDGIIDNPDRDLWSQVTNQIDDRFKISAAPVVISFPPFNVTFLGTWKEVYKASDYSRFYPTRRSLYSVAAAGVETGDVILDAGMTNLRSVNQVSRRLPWAVVTEKATAGSSTLQVDNADGEENLLRPAFDIVSYPDMPVVIQDRDGTWLLPTTGPNTALTLTLIGKTTTSLSLSGGLPMDVPVGATIFHIPAYDPTFTPSPATPYLKNYRVGFDVGVNLQEGLLTYIKPFPPLDGTFSLVPAELWIQPPGAGEVLDVFTNTNVSNTSPDRFPALDGSTEDDDGNRSFPILSPAPRQEIDHLTKETTAISDISAIVTSPFVGIGDLDATRTIITNQAGPWPSPIPKQFDIVAIRTGLNNLFGYQYIQSVNPAGTLTVATPYPLPGTGFEFAVSVSASLASGSGTVSPTTRLTDAGADFVTAGVQVGHTVVFTLGITFERRQVTAVVSPTELDIEAASTTGAVSYLVDDSLLTYGGPGSLLDEDLVPALDGQLDVLSTDTPPLTPWSELEALEHFLDHVMTDVLTSSNGATQSGLATLTDASVDFTSVSITSANFVFIRSGDSAGIYQVDEVTSPTTLNITGTFPDTGTGISYRIVETLGAGFLTLESVYQVLSQVDQAILDVTTFRTLLTTLVPVVGDVDAYAVKTVSIDLAARIGKIVTRQAQLTDADPTLGGMAALENIMTSGDRWYDKRYAWIDTRINLEKGILVKKDRAVENRIKAQADALNQLIKLLAVGS